MKSSGEMFVVVASDRNRQRSIKCFSSSAIVFGTKGLFSA